MEILSEPLDAKKIADAIKNIDIKATAKSGSKTNEEVLKEMEQNLIARMESMNAMTHLVMQMAGLIKGEIQSNNTLLKVVQEKLKDKQIVLLS
jgi:predicted transcriptional regulator